MADKVIAGSDHAGLALRAEAVKTVRAAGGEVEDLGPFSGDSVDYPDYAKAVAEAVAAGRARLGILVCGTGIGMSIAANKVAGARAALITDEWLAEMSRRHNDANVICVASRMQAPEAIERFTEKFLKTPFEGGRHARRVDKMKDLER